MNHQDIADAMLAIEKEKAERRRAFEAEYDEKYNDVRKACEAVGHIFIKSFWSFAVGKRSCAICFATEPDKNEMTPGD